jgi:hypothetical protein
MFIKSEASKIDSMHQLGRNLKLVADSARIRLYEVF